ncbi:MAG TPA: hypothetical protein VGL86_33300 [Polyangia bacterium]|jgi:sRNA-binding protein
MANKNTLSAHEIRALSAAGMLSPKAVRRYLQGEPTKELTKVRVEHAARQLGIELHVGKAGTDE